MDRHKAIVYPHMMHGLNGFFGCHNFINSAKTSISARGVWKKWTFGGGDWPS